ncbi:hypothetical protein GCM10009776_34760 [Microbacterium deminutum]|uniref:Uncharacterized protein n=1 Tax=Microbacterium deminutum TaxID=344164 RepID=A0ABN2RGE6_9MICO
MPDPGRSQIVTNTDVVLQPYHSIVTQGEYRRAFPNARRFVYVNPTSIDPWRLDRAAVKPPLLDIDDEWSLPRLDLTTTEGWRTAIDEAAWALASGPEQIHGVFIDDIDRVSAATAHAFVAGLQEALGWSPELFVNRGFHAWAGLTLGAVLIEDVRGGRVAEDDPDGLSRWVSETVIPALVGVRTNGAAVHRIEYLDTSARHDHPEDQLAPGLFDSTWITAPRSLNQWPAQLKKNKDETN